MYNNIELNNIYKEEVFENTRNMLKISCLLGSIVMLLFGIIDYMFEPANFKLFMSLRIIAVVYGLFIYILLLRKSKLKGLYLLGISFIYILCLILIIMFLVTEQNKLTYYEGLTLIVFMYHNIWHLFNFKYPI